MVVGNMYPVPWRVIRPPSCFVFFRCDSFFGSKPVKDPWDEQYLYFFNLYTYTCIYHKNQSFMLGKYTIYTPWIGAGKRLVGSGSRPSSPALIRPKVLPCGMWNVPLQRIPSVAARSGFGGFFPKRVGWKLRVGWIRVFLTIQGGPPD